MENVLKPSSHSSGESGGNTVSIVVTKGSASRTYTVTVTKTEGV